MKFVVPLMLAFVGVGAGVGAGVALRPDPGVTGAPGEAESHVKAPAESGAHGKDASHDVKNAGKHAAGHDGVGPEYVKLNNQFIVPILDQARVRSLVVLSIDLEVAAGQSETIHRVEPKIRDAFLTVLFDHANAGGFTGNFTSSGAMDILRTALREAGQKAVGDKVLSDVLITNIVRQDT